MATSGTIATTIISVSDIIDSAVRRCEFSPAGLNAEIIIVAKRNLFMILAEYADFGLNLWALEQNLIGLQASRARYALPAGTINLLELMHARPTRVEGTDTVAAQSVTTELDSATEIKRIGVKFDVISASETITLSYSDDDVTYEDTEIITKIDWEADTFYWFELDPLPTALFWKVSSTTDPITVNEFYLASEVQEIPIYPYNRTQFYNLVERKIKTTLPTNYYYERTTPLQYVNLWPLPNDDFGHLTLVRHREVQDVGALKLQLEIPNRWLNCIIWGLAKLMSVELPGISADRIALVGGEAEVSRKVAEREETDSAPTSYTPNIGCYTR